MSSGRAVISSWAASAQEAVAWCMSKATYGQVWPSIRPGAVLVTGSSGKGTTCRLLAEVLRAAGVHPVITDGWSRRQGFAAPAAGHASIQLVEVDPAALPGVVRRLPQPAALVFTNMLRDHAESATATAGLTARLERAISSLPASTTLILNADDPRVAQLGAGLPNPRLYFGMSDPVHGRVRRRPAGESSCCPRCGGRLSYDLVYYAHLGHWACAACGLSRLAPDVSATKFRELGSSSSRLEFAATCATPALEVPLPGMYNAYNALAAVTVSAHLGLPGWSLRAIENASGGPMRMERTHVAGHDVYLAVAANATGYTEVLHAILGDAEPRRMLLGLSSRQRSQRDISWIWDVDFESLAGLVPAPVICGNRAADLGVRLKYAGWLGTRRDQERSAACIQPDPIRALQAAIAGTPPGEPLWIVSTPTALQEIRRFLHPRDHVPDSRAPRVSEPRPTALRLNAPRLNAPRRGGPRRPGTQPAGPQPSGPSRPVPQPTAPPPISRRPDHASRRDWNRSHQPGQAGVTW